MTEGASKDMGKRLRYFAELLMKPQVSQQKSVAAFGKYKEAKEFLRAEEAALNDLYLAEHYNPRVQLESEYVEYVNERQAIFAQYLRTKKVAQLKQMSSLTNPYVNKSPSHVHTRYSNPKLMA